jgi:BMFP domain-containing protein YqiC
MQSTNRILDDLARVASGAIGTFGGFRQEVEGRLREQVERILASMDVVGREEFEAVKAVAAEARLKQEALERRLALLEAKLASAEDSGGPTGA